MIPSGDSAILELFSAYPILQRLPRPLQETLALNVQRVEAPAGSVLFDVDAPCSLFLLLTAGQVRVFRPGEEREIFLYTVERGQSCILTVSCLMGDARYPARGVVEEDVVGYALSRPIFLELLDRSPDFRHLIFDLFGERITDLLALIEEVAFRRLDQRLAGLLAERPDTFETTHQQLASELGSVREVVSRILKQFERKGMVRLERGLVHITDRQALREFAASPRD
ncbi:MAG: Crp/Fnr family transcriptional regulator [Caldilineae bacterium]|nr:MAG: Crp/Fnr family transcriptional regulator [Caldilineae bacterium]